MLKTIKTTKQIRLDELIKYIFDNEIESKQFLDDKKDIRVTVDRFGSVKIESNKSIYGPYVNNENLFAIEIEEEITDDMRFNRLVEVFSDTELCDWNYLSINEVKDKDTKRIYALINGELQLIYKRGDEK